MTRKFQSSLRYLLQNYAIVTKLVGVNSSYGWSISFADAGGHCMHVLHKPLLTWRNRKKIGEKLIELQCTRKYQHIGNLQMVKGYWISIIGIEDCNQE